MTVKTHMISSLVFAYPALIVLGETSLLETNDILYDQSFLLLYIGGVIFGSTFPDIDEPGSYIGRKLPFISHILNIFIQHRGITHTILILFLYFMMFFFAEMKYKEHIGSITEIFFLGFIVGNLGHILGDMTTKSGVTILYPFTSKSFGLLPKRYRYITGSAVEYLVVFPLFSILLFLESVNIFKLFQ